MGLTNKCNLNCAHCYSRALPIQSLTLGGVKKILADFPGLKKVNFGTGESILNPELAEIMAHYRERGIEMALTSNGTTIEALSDEHLKWFKDVDISLDFPSSELHDRWRYPGAFGKAMAGLSRCTGLGINTSIALCLMNINCQYLPQFKKILDQFNVSLRINLYKPTPTDKFSLNYDQFWDAMKSIAENFALIANSEPILSIIDRSKIGKGSPCGGDSVRVHPDGTITPCVFLAGKKIGIEEFKKMKSKLPEFCRPCKSAGECRGGCSSRRILKDRHGLPDEYCPFYAGREVPDIKFTYAKERTEYIHAGYLCTMIIR